MHSEGEDDGLVDALAAIRPDQDDAFARSMQDAVRRALVGAAAEPFRLGRFTVLAPLGGGGMGTVFVAYDPDLDRKIALKILHLRGERGRRDVLREGRALARLRHPNVVAVYEAGEVDEQVFVAMEYVAGAHLREWLREPRAPETVLARLVEAGRGLAAAHAQGLVHRDFKPENVVIDRDGHARVVDFGLARPLDELGAAAPVAGEAAATRSLRAGTPAYMAPERLAGGPGDARADQYAFCVSVWEALLGARPPAEAPGRRVPAWLRRALERGLARAPEQRWPAMGPLLAALERGRTRARVRTGALIAGAAAAIGATGYGIHRLDVARQEAARRELLARHEAACEDVGAAVASVWNDEARAGVRAAFAATGLAFAGQAADTLTPWLDERAARWRRARTTACRQADAALVGAWGPETYERAALCLEDRLVALEGLVAALSRANEAVVRKAVTIAAEPDRVDECLEVERMRRWPTPPDDARAALRAVREALAKASAEVVAGRYAEALAATTAAREQAEAAIDWPPLWAAARAQEGLCLEHTGAFAPSEAASADAYFAAARAGAWEVAADAATRLVLTVGSRRAKHDEGRAWGRHAETAIALAGDADGLRTAALDNALATVHFAARAFPEARALWEKALAIQERALGPDHPQVAATVNNLANAHNQTGAYAEARPLYERALAIKQAALGPDHPDVANSHNGLAALHTAMGERAAAQAAFERALEIYERSLGPDHPDVAMALDNLAALYNTGGDPETALRMRERALAIRERALGPNHPDVATSLSNLGNVRRARKEYPAALALYERSLAITEQALGPDSLDAAKVLNNLALVRESMGEMPAARALYERSVSTLEKALGPDHPFVGLGLYNLGRHHMVQSQPAAALPRFERAVQILTARPGVQPAEHEARLDLARALVLTGGDRTRALAEARAARDGFAAAGPSAAESLARAEKWLASQGVRGASSSD